MIFGASPVALVLAWTVLVILCLLFSLRGWALLRQRSATLGLRRLLPSRRDFSIRELVRVSDDRPSDLSMSSLTAAFFGVLAILSLGVVVPLGLVDAMVGGSNIANLIQSLLTVCAFWSFRSAVRAFVNPEARSYRTRLLVALLIAITIPFFMIADRGTTSALFMSEHADQTANVIYNVVYMGVLAWIVGDMIWALRGSARSIYAVFLAGLALVLLSCLDEIAYICIAHFWQGAAAEVTYYAFYVLFFGGILVVAVGWTWVIVAERNYVGGLIWRFRSTGLALLLLRVRRAAKSDTMSADLGGVSRPSSQGGDSRGPRLKGARYVAPRTTLPTLTVIPTDTARETVRTLLGANSEDVAYRLVVQIRNTATRHGVKLAAHDETRLTRVETLFPGFALRD